MDGTRSARPVGPFAVAALALLLVGMAACSAHEIGPAPSGLPRATGPPQADRYRTGQARLRITAPVRMGFAFRLEPSALYASPPPRLDLSYGDPATGAGLDLELRPVPGTAATSLVTVLALDVRLAGDGSFTATSMDGECSITLSEVTPAVVRGRFGCRALQEDVGSGPTLAATGTFTARA